MRIMFAQIVLAIASLCSLYASDLKGQDYLNKPVSVTVSNMEIKKIISAIEAQANVKFVYSPKAIQASRKVSVTVSNQRLGDFLNDIFRSLEIGYTPTDDQIILFSTSHIKPVPLTETAESATNLVAGKTADIVITGTVKDAKGDPLVKVSITEKGTRNVVLTDENGNFKINVKSEQSVLQLSAVGYLPSDIAVGNRRSLDNIVMVLSNKDMEDVIVVGYGRQKKATSTGAQSSIDGKTLLKSPVANVSNSLVGRVTGVTAIQASGEPGADQSTIRIRGVGTFAGSQDPLVLVDGIQVPNYNNIDPNEIENITILKDASSTAVYGIRGANGVIIITTKSGTIGPPSVGYSYNYASNSFTDIRKSMSSYDYANSFNQALFNDAYITNSQGSFIPRFNEEALAKYKSGEDPIFFPDVNWFDLVYKKSSAQQQHNLNIRGGTDKAKYFISAGFFDQQGLFNNTKLVEGYDAQIKFRRYNFRSNLDFNVTKRLKVAVKLSTQTEVRSGTNIADTRTIIDNILRASPLSAPGIVDGKLVLLSTNAGENPLFSLFNTGFRTSYRNFLNGSVRVDHNLDFITKGLTTHGEIAYQNFNASQTTYLRQPVLYRALRGADGKSAVIVPLGDEQVLGSFAVTPNKNTRLTAEFALDYKRDFNGHTISGLVLYNQIRATDPTYFLLVANTYQSVVGRATYDFRRRYLAEVNIAYNGSENFAPGNRFGVFPSYSAGWVPTEEAFFPKNKTISFLKFRGSYGEVGNDQIGSGIAGVDFLQSANRFLYLPNSFSRTGGYFTGLNLSGYGLIGGAAGLREGRSNNPLLTWERAIKSNIGFEATLLNEKVSITFDLFKEKRDNILATVNMVGGLLGNQGAPKNFGKMENKGYEIDLGYNDKINAFSYFAKANVSFARNKIIERDEIPRPNAYRRETGNRFGQNFGLVADGFFNSWEEVNDGNRPKIDVQNNRLQPGDVKFRDINGDGIVNIDDEVPLGYSSIPEFVYGFSLGASYKGFDVSVLFQGVENVSLEYTRRTTQAFHDAIPSTAVETLLESWTPERYAQGLPIKFPRFAVGNFTTDKNNYRKSSLFVVDASYLRFKNMEVGYTITPAIFRRIGIKSTRIYVNGNNLLTWTKVVKGLDPENPFTPTNLEPYPLVKTINFGANLNF